MENLKNVGVEAISTIGGTSGGGGGGKWQVWTSIACISVAAVFMAGAGYSLGKNEDDKNSDLYKAAIAFLVIGILMVVFLGVWLGVSKCSINVKAGFNALG